MRHVWRLLVVWLLLAAGLVGLPANPAAALDVQVTDCEDDDAFVPVLSNVQASDGGTITFACGEEPVTITLESEQTISRPTLGVVIDGGGLVTLSGGNATRLFYVEQDASLELRNITLTGGNDSGSLRSGEGGAIFNNRDQVTIAGSTLSGNSASRFAGAIDAESGTVSITSSTLSANDAPVGAAINVNVSVMFTLYASIIDSEGSSASACSFLLSARINSLGYNLSTDDCCFLTSTGDLPTTDPLLGPLADNGGPTQTHRPLPTSPAIDHIPASACPINEQGTILPDQRGVSRPQNGRCDIGSVEVLSGSLCVNPSTRAVTEPDTNGCGRFARTLSLEYDGPLTLCANRVTGELHLSPSGQCARTQLRLVIPDDGPVTVCVHQVTRFMRLAGASGCTRYEVARETGGIAPAT